MKAFNKYHILLVVSFVLFLIFWLSSGNGSKKVNYCNYPLDVIDNEIVVKETGEVLYRFIPIDGGTMEFSYTDSLIFDGDTTTSVFNCYKDIPSFLLGETPVTMRLWDFVMNDDRRLLPENHLLNFFHVYKDSVYAYGWDLFIKRLEDLTGSRFCLPSSFQWEYAARGGNKSHNYIYSGSNSIDEVAFYKGNSSEIFAYRSGMQKKSNELGLYDMSGNVWELTTTVLGEVLPQKKSLGDSDPVLFMGISRGGNWEASEVECRVDYMSTIVRFYSGARLVLIPNSNQIVTEIYSPIKKIVVTEDSDYVQFAGPIHQEYRSPNFKGKVQK